jgi:hypothetical protein
VPGAGPPSPRAGTRTSGGHSAPPHPQEHPPLLALVPVAGDRRSREMKPVTDVWKERWMRHSLLVLRRQARRQHPSPMLLWMHMPGRL